MLTLLLSYLGDIDTIRLIGYVTACLEILYIVVKFLIIVVPEDSKFNKFLHRLFKGIDYLKDVIHQKQEESEDVDDDDK